MLLVDIPGDLGHVFKDADAGSLGTMRADSRNSAYNSGNERNRWNEGGLDLLTSIFLGPAALWNRHREIERKGMQSKYEQDENMQTDGNLLQFDMLTTFVFLTSNEPH
jgi:hypothetical protein